MWAFIRARMMLYSLTVPWMFSTLLVFRGSCEAATSKSSTSASFNKQSLPISKPLSQTNSMIKRHTWGEPRGNLPFCLLLPCFSICLFLFVSHVLLLIFSPGMQEEHYLVLSPPWLDFTESSIISCHENLRLPYMFFFHFPPRTQWPESISYMASPALCHTSLFSVSFNLTLILNLELHFTEQP